MLVEGLQNLPGQRHRGDKFLPQQINHKLHAFLALILDLISEGFTGTEDQLTARPQIGIRPIRQCSAPSASA